MGGPIYKTIGEIEIMHEANKLVQRILDGLAERIEPGVTTAELDRWAEATIRQAGGAPAFLNYRGFPATLCTALNDVIVHGFPDKRPLQNGDIIGLDCGVMYQGYFGDAARTFIVGDIEPNTARLLRVTEESLMLAAQLMWPGRRLSDLGHAVQQHVESHGFSVVRKFVGHGVGMSLHEEPQVANFGRPGKGLKLRPGLVLAIEPMVNAGTAKVREDADGWTARTLDGSLSAHFEYSVAITERGPWILGVSAEKQEQILSFQVEDQIAAAS